MIRLIIADDHAVLRQGIKALLAGAKDIRVVAEAGSGDALLAQLATTAADIVLLDISMPGPTFLDLLRLVAEVRPQARVIVLSAHAEQQYAVRAFRSGASGYVTKDRSAEELLDAIHKVAAGGKYVSAVLAELLAHELSGGTAVAPHEALSKREFEVLCRIGAGQSVKEVAAELGISARTVSTYRQRLLDKLRLRTTAELIRYAVERGLLA